MKVKHTKERKSRTKNFDFKTSLINAAYMRMLFK